MDRVICFGARRGKEFTYALLDEWRPEPDAGRDEALAELALRYFTSRGPAALADFIGWSGLFAGEARAGLEMARPRLAEETFAGRSCWMAPDAASPEPGSRTAYALPGFDEYLLGYRDRSAALDPEHAQQIVPGGNGVFKPTIVIDGRIVGTWDRAFKRGGIAISTSPFTPMSAEDEALFAGAIDRYAALSRRPRRLTSRAPGGLVQ